MKDNNKNRKLLGIRIRNSVNKHKNLPDGIEKDIAICNDIRQHRKTIFPEQVVDDFAKNLAKGHAEIEELAKQFLKPKV